MAFQNMTSSTTTTIFCLDIQLGRSTGEVAFYYLGLLLKMYVNPLLGLSGLLINIINTFVFSKMGLSDGETQNFLILSIFDGLSAAAALTNSLNFILVNTIYARGGQAARELQAVFWATVVSWLFSQIVSCITTTVITVVQFCCVAMPLKVKRVMTVRLQLVVIAAFSVAVDSVLVYNFAPTTLNRVSNPHTNMSKMANEGTLYSLPYVFTNMFFHVNFVVVILCLVFLVFSLNGSSEIRKQPPKVSASEEKKNEKSRELRVVQTVILVAASFVIFNIPTVIMSIIRQVTPAFSVRRHLQNWYDFFLIFMETSLLLNVLVKIFIYFFFNSRYRNILRKVIGKRAQLK